MIPTAIRFMKTSHYLDMTRYDSTAIRYMKFSLDQDNDRRPVMIPTAIRYMKTSHDLDDNRRPGMIPTAMR